jgi:hypothetical protein
MMVPVIKNAGAKMVKNEHKTNWILDVVLFVGLLVSFWLDLTGVGWHQWLGLGLGVVIGYHFLAHWKWVEAVGGRLFGRSIRRARLYFVIDLALLAGFYLIGLTGLIISTWLGLELGNYAAWRDLHVWVSIGTLALVVLKIGLHQGWIITTARRYFGQGKAAGRGSALPVRPPASLEHTQLVTVPAKSVAASVNTSRRDFLILMGTVGAAAIVSTFGVLHDPAAASGTNMDEDQLTSLIDEGSQSTTSQSAAASSGACYVRCDRRCSYPGHCKRYQDTNGNGRCDWGECA